MRIAYRRGPGVDVATIGIVKLNMHFTWLCSYLTEIYPKADASLTALILMSKKHSSNPTYSYPAAASGGP